MGETNKQTNYNYKLVEGGHPHIKELRIAVSTCHGIPRPCFSSTGLDLPSSKAKPSSSHRCYAKAKFIPQVLCIPAAKVEANPVERDVGHHDAALPRHSGPSTLFPRVLSLRYIEYHGSLYYCWGLVG